MSILGQDADARRPDYRVHQSRVDRALEGAGGKSSGMGHRNHNDSSELKVAAPAPEPEPEPEPHS